MKLNEIVSDIGQLCKKYGITDYTVNDDGSIDVIGDVNFSFQRFDKFPIKFGHVTGFFSCDHCTQLTTLEGAPTTVENFFSCVGCSKLTSLEHCPKTVNGSFNCRGCVKVSSLEHCPTSLKGSFTCDGLTLLTSLKGCPSIFGSKFAGSFSCINCNNITSLEGCPTEVPGDFSCGGCTRLLSLEHCPKVIGGDFSCYMCINLTSLKELGEVGGTINFNNCPKCTDILTTLFRLRKKNKTLKVVLLNSNKLENILNTYLAANDLVGCQDELMDIPALEKYAE